MLNHRTSALRVVLAGWHTAVVIIVSLLVSSAASAQGFDISAVIGKRFWFNAGDLALGQTISLPAGNIMLIDSYYCGISAGELRYLFATHTGNTGSPVRVFKRGDCDKSPSDLLDDQGSEHFDSVLVVGLVGEPNQIRALTKAFVVRPGAAISDALIAQIRQYEKKFPISQVRFEQQGSQVAIDLTSRISGDTIIVTGTGRDPNLPHNLTVQDIPTLTNAADSTNLAVSISHRALSAVAANYLQTQTFPIRQTSAVARAPIYSGDRDNVGVKMTIQDSQRSIAAEAKWTGPELLLSQVTASSLRDCSNQSGFNRARCETLKAAETVAANAIAAGILQQNKQSRMIPFDSTKPLKISMFDREFLLLIVTAKTSASSKALTVTGDLYVRPFN